MKKTLLSLCIGIGLIGLQAQCTIDFGAPEGLTPNVETNLPIALVEKAYHTVLQFEVPRDTVTSLGVFYIEHIKIDSIQGLPKGFTHQTNPAGSVFPGGTKGCILVTGNPVAAQIDSSPKADGIYPITVHFTSTVNIFTVPTQFPDTYEGYRIHIARTIDVQDRQIKPFSISPARPNPAQGSTDFVINTNATGNMDFMLYDFQGRTVSQQQIATHQGENGFHLDLGNLKAGIYMYSFRKGNTQVTQRLIVE